MSEEGCKLFVYGVGENISRDEMENEFSVVGTVRDAYNTGKGYAFITLASPQEAQAAVSQLHGADMFGQTIKVDVAKPQGDRGGRGGRGGRGQGGRGRARGSGCYTCGEDGHRSFECSQGGGGGGGGRGGGRGRARGSGSPGQGGRGRGRGGGCYTCGEDGHRSFECSQGGGGGGRGGGRSRSPQ